MEPTRYGADVANSAREPPSRRHRPKRLQKHRWCRPSANPMRRARRRTNERRSGLRARSWRFPLDPLCGERAHRGFPKKPFNTLAAAQRHETQPRLDAVAVLRSQLGRDRAPHRREGQAVHVLHSRLRDPAALGSAPPAARHSPAARTTTRQRDSETTAPRRSRGPRGEAKTGPSSLELPTPLVIV